MAIIRKIAAALVFILVSCVTYAQQEIVDSIRNRLNAHPAEDKVRVQLLSDLAYYIHYFYSDSTVVYAEQAYNLAVRLQDEQGKGDALKHWAIGLSIMLRENEAIEKNNQALAIFEKLGDKKGKGAVLNNTAIMYHNKGEFQTALQYYRKSMKIREEINDIKGVSDCYNNIGNIYTDLGHFSQALLCHFKGLQIREKLNIRSAIANSLSNISHVYFLLGKYDGALRYGLQAYNMYKELGNPDGIVQSTISVGGVYHQQKKYDEALRYLFEGLKLSKKMGTLNSEAVCLTNIGETYNAIEKYTEAEKCYKRALQLSEQGGDMEGVAVCNTGLGLACLRTGREEESIAYLRKSADLASGIGSRMRALEATRYLAEAYEKVNNLRLANDYLKRFIAYKDSLFTEESDKRSQQTEFSYMLDKKQKEIALLHKDRSIQEGENERQRLLMSILLLGITFLSLAFFVVYKSRQKEKISKELILVQKAEIEKQAQKLEELNALKDKTFSVLSHDLRSPVAVLVNVMLLLKDKMITQEEFNRLQGSFSEQLNALTHLLDNLLHWAKSHMKGEHAVSPVKFSIDQVVRQNISLLKEAALQKTVALQAEAGGNTMVMADQVQVDIVVRNLLSNAIKFTHAGGRIEITVREKGGYAEVSVRDTGIGISDEARKGLFSETVNSSSFGTAGEKGTGIGLILSKEFVENNGGTLTVESEEGTGSVFTFTLPLA